MQIFIALLRGINVGGHHKVPMAELRELCESIGLKSVKTYIQSGNIVFESEFERDRISADLEKGIEDRFGFKIPVQVITKSELNAAANAYPFPTEDHKCAHIMFLGARPNKEAAGYLNDLEQGPDLFELDKKALFFFFPNGVSGVRLNLAKIERRLGVSTTSRNWRTVQKLIEMTS